MLHLHPLLVATSLLTARLPCLAQTGKGPALPQPRSTLAVGDSCYVTATVVNLRNEPTATSMSICLFKCNERLKVVEIPNKNWVRVNYYNGDVGVYAYIAARYLAKIEQP